ncbi:MAG: sensor histidine kinase [bacterium]
MLEFFQNLLSSDGFMPHGHCYLWRPGLVWLHVISDALTALAYTSIPFTLVYFIRRRSDVPFHWMFLCFGVFIIACGATHAMDVWTLWRPTYWLSGVIKAITALASLPTAVLLIRLVPSALAIPTPAQLSKVHDDLRAVHEALELRVQERTAELARKNAELANEIAERERAQAALAASQRRFNRLADAGIIGVITSDLAGNIREANGAFLQMVGYTAADVLGGKVRWSDMTPPEFRELGDRAVEQLRTTGVAAPWEKEYICKDGSRVSALVGVATVDASSGEQVGFVLDLTERKRAAEAIRQLERQREADARFRALLEAAPDAMVIADDLGRIALVNAAAEQLFGYARADLLGSSVEVLVPERFRAAHTQHRTAFRHPTGRRAIGAGQQLVALRRDGSEFPVDISISTLQIDGGLLISTTIRDVTQRKLTEEALQQAKDTAEAANAELETFSYSVAHDLRSPLRAMSGYSTAVLEDYGNQLDDDAKRSLARVVASSQQMSEIIDALLQLARLTRTAPRYEYVDLTRLGSGVIDRLRATDPRRVVDFVAADDLVVQGDPELLGVLLDNLLSNAWKFTGKQPAARVELGRKSVDGASVFYVRDNGAGFDMKLVDKLFVPFRRLHNASEFEGTGLGLATVQRIIRLHGGRVWAEGAEHRGATFCFTLPTPARAKTASWSKARAR